MGPNVCGARYQFDKKKKAFTLNIWTPIAQCVCFLCVCVCACVCVGGGGGGGTPPSNPLEGGCFFVFFFHETVACDKQV